jgi:hypothetical protein
MLREIDNQFLAFALYSLFSTILCGFVHVIADTALSQGFYGGKDGRVMVHPEGFR